MSTVNYDAWLERPYQERYAQEPPGWVQDLMDLEFWFEGEKVKVMDWEPWADADEDGRHGGIDLVVRVDGSNRTYNMSQGDVQEILLKQDEHR